MPKPFFSVIIPLYNKENYIQATIESILNQTFLDFEIVIINDGSTDNSLTVAEESLKIFEQKTIISQENRGLSATRNKAISIAKGEIIALLDADDLWKPNYLKALYQLVLEFPEAKLFGTDYAEYYSNTLQLKPKKNIAKTKENSSFIVEDFFKASLFQPITIPSSFAFKREVSNNIQFNEKVTFAEDIEFYIKTNLTFKMAFNYTTLVISRQDIPNQMTKIGFKGKVLPDLYQFEKEAKQNFSLEKYLDTNRYYFLSQCRLSQDTKNEISLKKHLNYSNLTVKQQFLLKSPFFVFKSLKKIKAFLLKRKVKMTSY